MTTQTNPLMIWVGRSLAIIGMFFPIWGNFIPPSPERAWCFVLGGALMLLATIIEKQAYFFVLQLIVLVGAGLYFVTVPLAVKIIIPIAICISYMIYCAMHGQFKDRTLILGIIGIGFLSLGYGIGHPIVYLLGGITLAIYSWMAYFQGVKIAILWGLLNTFFTLAVIYNILKF